MVRNCISPWGGIAKNRNKAAIRNREVRYFLVKSASFLRTLTNIPCYYLIILYHFASFLRTLKHNTQHYVNISLVLSSFLRTLHHNLHDYDKMSLIFRNNVVFNDSDAKTSEFRK